MHGDRGRDIKRVDAKGAKAEHLRASNKLGSARERGCALPFEISHSWSRQDRETDVGQTFFFLDS